MFENNARNPTMIRYMSGDRTGKLLLILGFCLAAYSAITLFRLQPQGYVIDIYSTLPISFYVALLLCYIISCTVLFTSKGDIKKLGIILLILNHLLILLIPYSLGYYSMGRADDMSYIGEYSHISNIGFISDWDIYPAGLVLGAVTSFITGFSPNIVSFIIPIVFSFIFIIGTYLCCRSFLKDDTLVTIAIPASFILYLGPYNFFNVPNGLFFSFVPLYLHILIRYLKKNDIFNTVLLLLPTLLVPFMHPFIVFFLASLLIFLILSGRLLNRYVLLKLDRSVSIFLLVVIGFSSWFIYCHALLSSAKMNIVDFLDQTSDSTLSKTTTLISKSNIDILSLIKLVLLYYGRYLIPLIVISISVLLVYLYKNKIPPELKKQMNFFLLFYFLFTIIEAIFFINPLIAHQPDRLTNLNFMVYAQVPLFVLSIYVILFKIKPISHPTVLLILFLTGMWALSFFGTFDSPFIFKPNIALTYNEVDGMQWYTRVQDSNYMISPLSPIGRFYELFDSQKSNIWVPILDHFGYDVNSNKSFVDLNLEDGQNSYVILMSCDELLYQQVPGYMEVGRFTAKDYARLRSDPSLNEKVYDSLNLQIYNIQI